MRFIKIQRIVEMEFKDDFLPDWKVRVADKFKIPVENKIYFWCKILYTPEGHLKNNQIVLGRSGENYIVMKVDNNSAIIASIAPVNDRFVLIDIAHGESVSWFLDCVRRERAILHQRLPI